MTDDIYRSQFRLPPGLHKRLKAAAKKNHRSLNAELVAALEKGLDQQDLETASGKRPEDLGDECLEEAAEAFLRAFIQRRRADCEGKK